MPRLIPIASLLTLAISAALPLFALRAGERLLLREEAGRFSLKGGEGAPYTERDVVTFFESGEWLPTVARRSLDRSVTRSIGSGQHWHVGLGMPHG